MLKASRAERGTSTTPEPPGITGPGPPVTEDASGGPHPGRKQGGTVECVFRIPPLILHQGWDFLPRPVIQGGITMSEESNLYTFENESYRKTYWHT